MLYIKFRTLNNTWYESNKNPGGGGEFLVLGQQTNLHVERVVYIHAYVWLKLFPISSLAVNTVGPLSQEEHMATLEVCGTKPLKNIYITPNSTIKQPSLFQAAKKGNLEEVKRLLALPGADIYECNTVSLFLENETVSYATIYGVLLCNVGH